MIYLNNAGTSWPKAPAVPEAVAKTLTANPQELGSFFESAHRTVCEFLGIVELERFLFTTGCTAALSVALADLPLNDGDVVVTSSLEHHAMIRPIELLKRARGVEHVAAPYRPGEPLDLDFVRQILKRGRVRLIAVTAASNVTGELLPIVELARLAHDHDALLLVDAAQTVGVVSVDVQEIGADMLVFAGHKGPLGPQGIGGLWAAPEVLFESPSATCEVGGSGTAAVCAPMPGYCDVGSVNMSAAAGLASGIDWLVTNASNLDFNQARALACDLAAALRERPYCKVYGGHDVERTATLSMTIDGLPLDRAEEHFFQQGIVVRAGQHCAPLALDAIGAPEGTVRISIGPFNRSADIECYLAAVDLIAELPQSS